MQSDKQASNVSVSHLSKNNRVPWYSMWKWYFNELCSFDNFWIWKVWNDLKWAAVKISLFVVIDLIYILLHFLFGKMLCLWKQWFTCCTLHILQSEYCGFFKSLKLAKYLAKNWADGKLLTILAFLYSISRITVADVKCISL